MAEKKTWTRKEIFSLISQWEARPELWDVKHRDFRNKIKKQKLLADLAVRFNTDEIEINRKLHNLRTQFHQELRKIARKQSDAPDANGTFQSSWEFFNVMGFIRGDYFYSKSIEMDDSQSQDVFENVNEKSTLEKTATNLKRPCDIKESREAYIPDKSTRLSNLAVDEFQIFGDLVVSELRNLRSRENQNELKRMILRAISHISEVDDRRASSSELHLEPNASESYNYPSRPSSSSSYHSKFSPEEQGVHSIYNQEKESK
ncbi:uncharacterized protein LOC123004789 isoform X2 [Tribolium madens]|uniref:uncharacterized protein LOC123004789 isoform X2 n=1 Tax=Tribolium madens TaxID=41895 RepID=UPI001CF76617|nr:uncharacterized protein LOC123004789 isoform X2 [Tribolium madens]